MSHSPTAVADYKYDVISVVCLYLPNDCESSAKRLTEFRERVIPWVVAESGYVVCTGYIALKDSDEAQQVWAAFEKTLLNSKPSSVDNKTLPEFLILPFSYNAGKSTYINCALHHEETKKKITDDAYVVTIDCDMFPVMYPRPWSLGDLVGLMDYLHRHDNYNHRVGILAPQQVPALRCRHSDTVFENSVTINWPLLISPGPISNRSLSKTNAVTTIWWSSKHPSVAGGLWVFKKSIYDQVPGGFAEVGTYGPEDVLFAAYVMRNLQLRCCLVREFLVMHELPEEGDPGDILVSCENV